MTAEEAAQRWAGTWARGWVEHDVEPIAALYAEDAVFRSSPFREPGFGPTGVRAYAEWAFADEESAVTWFGEPLVVGDRATGEWWAMSKAAGADETLAGVSLLRFDADGLVVEQHDYWSSEPGHREPHEHFGRGPQG